MYDVQQTIPFNRLHGKANEARGGMNEPFSGGFRRVNYQFKRSNDGFRRLDGSFKGEMTDETGKCHNYERAIHKYDVEFERFSGKG